MQKPHVRYRVPWAFGFRCIREVLLARELSTHTRLDEAIWGRRVRDYEELVEKRGDKFHMV